MSISDQLKEAFDVISSLTTMTRDEFADEYRNGGMDRIDQLLAEAKVPPWEGVCTSGGRDGSKTPVCAGVQTSSP